MEALGACNQETHIRCTRSLWLLIAVVSDFNCKMCCNATYCLVYIVFILSRSDQTPELKK